MLIGLKLSKSDPDLEKVIDAIVSNFLDERKFHINSIVEITGLSKNKVEAILKRLEARGIVRKRGNMYQLVDPLVFLTPIDMERARRITKDDNILYGAYQNPYLPRLYFLAMYLIFAADIAFVISVFFNIFPGLTNWVLKILPEGVSVNAFLLFTLGMGIIFVDALDNIIKSWAREKYSVVVGEKSGISYDKSLADELSGKIRRGAIADVDLQFSLLQKILNYFIRVPVGDVIVRVKGEEKPVVFKNMPYPRELFYVIRSIQLGSLGWRKRYARTLMMWRARAMVPAT
jgi:DNA-binding MarR family transcriptional regulator